MWCPKIPLCASSTCTDLPVPKEDPGEQDRGSGQGRQWQDEEFCPALGCFFGVEKCRKKVNAFISNPAQKQLFHLLNKTAKDTREKQERTTRRHRQGRADGLGQLNLNIPASPLSFGMERPQIQLTARISLHWSCSKWNLSCETSALHTHHSVCFILWGYSTKIWGFPHFSP